MHPILEHCIKRYPQLKSTQKTIEEAIECLRATFANKHKLLLCGNGGSAADADHIAGELLKGFNSKRPLGRKAREQLGDSLAQELQGALPAIPLPSLVGINTAYGNDCNSNYTFAQLVWGLGLKGDALLCISTSGNSKNVLHAADVANAMQMSVLGLTGAKGGALKNKCDVCICAPEEEVYKIQELHLPIYHTVCLVLEDLLF